MSLLFSRAANDREREPPEVILRPFVKSYLVSPHLFLPIAMMIDLRASGLANWEEKSLSSNVCGQAA